MNTEKANQTLMALISDDEYELVTEALCALRETKVAAWHVAQQIPGTQSFTARDFGVPQIDALLTRLGAEVPMEGSDAVAEPAGEEPEGPRP